MYCIRHIQNPAIFRTLLIIVNSDIFPGTLFTSYLDIFRYVVAYLEPCVALAYSEPEHIQNTYLEPFETILFQCVEHHHQVFRKSRVSVSSVDNLVVPVEEHKLCVKSVQIRSFLWSVFSPNVGK